MTSLNLVLRLNAASCFGFGVTFVLGPGAVSAFLGTMPANLLAALGVVLLLNGAHLSYASLRARPVQAEILWFSLGDLAWWLGTLVLIAAGLWIGTATGTLVALLVALAVACLGIAQLVHLGLMRSGLPASEHWRRIGQSWLALPLWVRIWLFALNAAFLVAPLFLPWTESRIILIAYLASGPFLLGFAVFEGGLSRLMGVGHIVPWLPLLGWLAHWLVVADSALPVVAYVATLGIMIAACLAFDIIDIFRWVRGERGVLATP